MRFDWRSGVVNLGPFTKGMCNKTTSRTLPEDTVRNAVNVDFVRDEIVSRDGISKVLSATKPRGGYSCPAGLFFVEGPVLKSFVPPTTTSTVFTGIRGDEFAWAYDNEIVYFSDGYISLKIVNGVASYWGMAVPSQPLLSGVAGTYGAGIYLGAVCFVDANGLESGASELSSVTLNGSTGVKFSNLPLTTDPQVIALRLYLSEPNGSELYHIADVAVGTAEYTITAGRYDDSSTLETKFVSPPPPGRIIKFYNGRAYVADNTGLVWYSDPFEYDHFRLGSNFLQFSTTVEIMEPVTGGIFFAYGDVTKFYGGEVEDGFTVTHKADYGGVRGTSRRIPNSDNVCWQSQRGLVIGGPGGAMANRVEDLVATHSGTSGSSMLREKDGVRQFITTIQNPTVSPLAASSFIDAEIIRKGE